MDGNFPIAFMIMEMKFHKEKVILFLYILEATLSKSLYCPLFLICMSIIFINWIQDIFWAY